MPAGYIVYGPPNEFPDPAIDLPYWSADDPYPAALLLRTCLLAKKNAVGSSVTNDAVMQRAWDYLEMMWRTTGEMAGTWSPYPNERVWYAHWHGEIIETLVQCIKLSAHLPAGIPIATVKARLLATSQWLKDYGVENFMVSIFSSEPYRTYPLLAIEPNRTDNLEKIYARILEEHDNQRSLPRRYDSGEVAFPTYKFSWVFGSRAQRNEFYRFLHYVCGRQKAFWIPTWSDDFRLVEAITAGDTTIDVENVGLEDFSIDRENRHIVIIQQGISGYQFTPRQIISSTAPSANVSRLTLDREFLADIDLESVAMVCFLYLGRLDNDQIEIKHHSDRVATVSTVMKAVWEIRNV